MNLGTTLGVYTYVGIIKVYMYMGIIRDCYSPLNTIKDNMGYESCSCQAFTTSNSGRINQRHTQTKTASGRALGDAAYTTR